MIFRPPQCLNIDVVSTKEVTYGVLTSCEGWDTEESLAA